MKLAEEFRRNLVARILREESSESLEILHGIKTELLKELSAGRRIPEEIGQLTARLPEVKIADELKISMERFLQLAAELYRTRSSVSSTFTLAQAFYDRLITTAFDHTLDILEKEGLKLSDLSWVILVSGEMGRGESILGSRSRFFFIYREPVEIPREDITELAMRFMAVLSLCFPFISRNLNNHSAFWFGPDTEWQRTAAGLHKTANADNWNRSGGKTFAQLLDIAADMRIVCGDHDFGLSIVESGRRLLADCMQSETFRHLAKDIATMPVAIGIFGRLKTVSTGKNRGKIDLKGMAIDPLAAAVRLLSLTGSRHETSFAGRVKSILAAGNMGVSLADRLLIAYQDFMRERIRLELIGPMGPEGLFLNPDDLDEESRERFKAGLEDITTLQRLVHQQLVEVEQG
jgi:signal-transduction protein with cAMP-binding, CBS, and nucleotidyltransferase domain